MAPFHWTLIEMVWPQPKTPIQCDNSTAIDVSNETTIPKKTQINRYAISMAPLLGLSKPILLLLGTWHIKYRQLQHQESYASLSRIPQAHSFRMTNSQWSLQGCVDPHVTTRDLTTSKHSQKSIVAWSINLVNYKPFSYLLPQQWSSSLGR